MPKSKVAVSIEEALVGRVDRLVREEKFASRSAAVEIALAEKLDRVDRLRLARECAKLDAREERAMADEGLATDATEWPEY